MKRHHFLRKTSLAMEVDNRLKCDADAPVKSAVHGNTHRASSPINLQDANYVRQKNGVTPNGKVRRSMKQSRLAARRRRKEQTEQQKSRLTRTVQTLWNQRTTGAKDMTSFRVSIDSKEKRDDDEAEGSCDGGDYTILSPRFSMGDSPFEDGRDSPALSSIDCVSSPLGDSPFVDGCDSPALSTRDCFFAPLGDSPFEDGPDSPAFSLRDCFFCPLNGRKLCLRCQSR